VSKIAVIYYSASGHVQQLAEAIAAGAADVGAKVRLRRVAEPAPEDVTRQQDAWHDREEGTVGIAEEAQLDDLEWADGFALGSPSRYGLPAAQLKAFIDQTGPMWINGQLSNKVATSFTSSANAHGGQESTLLALNNTFYHWGSLIVPPGYTNPLLSAAGGNPYGTSYVSGLEGDPAVSQEALAAAGYQGRRLAQSASLLVSPRRNANTSDPLSLNPYDPIGSSMFEVQGRERSP